MQHGFDTDAEDKKLADIHEREEEDVTRILSEKYGIHYTDLTVVPIDMEALRLISETDAEQSEAIAFEKNGKHLSLALRNPVNENVTRVLHDLETQGFLIEQYLMSHRSLAKGLAQYKELSFASKSSEGVFAIDPERFKTLTQELGTVSALREFLVTRLQGKERAQISLVLEGILASAFALRASDIHFEPEEENVRLRLRLDGVLTDIFFLDPHSHQLINSRIKLLSGLKLNVANRAQDGRFSVQLSGKEIEIRTSIIPGNYGESAVLRILDPSGIERGLTSMGIHPKLLERLLLEIRRPNGLLLTTGPTGSGKTTTLYAFLREIHTPDIKIVTIEDPVEYHLPGIVQTQIDGHEYTFASGLRSVLRQDPDVIMVGEIRDMEVAETAIQAALTGHFVFSTLHTNNAAGAFPRLMDLGVDPKTIPSAVTVAMAQRLVRTLNPETKIKRPSTPDEKRMMEKAFETLTDSSLRPVSFDEVWVPGNEEDGYKGRVGLYEAIFMDQQLADLLRMGPSSAEIEKDTRRQGQLTMAQDGIIKALAGLTSLEEVFSVVDVPLT